MITGHAYFGHVTTSWPIQGVRDILAAERHAFMVVDVLQCMDLCVNSAKCRTVPGRYSFVHNPPRSCVIPDFPQLQKQPLASQCCTNISCLHICFEPINLSCSIKADLVLLICPRFCVKPVCIWYCLHYEQ
ncbi:hypothetical protein NDU88_000420 [Pleurodeles waltl]|uniref:Apple domain-containing protein n=1 Tax=Pleurodeles waltl TaxID=8319 RepID=A0AAV7KPX6_PLEWA|nr:hypothetical protein NDU88_000420 [Pleurodeles waltl]